MFKWAYFIVYNEKKKIYNISQGPLRVVLQMMRNYATLFVLEKNYFLDEKKNVFITANCTLYYVCRCTCTVHSGPHAMQCMNEDGFHTHVHVFYVHVAHMHNIRSVWRHRGAECTCMYLLYSFY